MKRSLLVVISLWSALSALGCIGQTDEPATGDDPATADAPAEGLIAQTVVVIDPDGSVREFHHTLTEDQLAAEVDENTRLRVDAENGIGIASQAITLDQNCANVYGGYAPSFCSPPCAGSSFWIWDSSSRDRSMVCFYGAGQVDLSTVTHYVPGSCGPAPFHPCNIPSGNWSTNVKSFWAWDEPGNFSLYPVNYCPYSTSFNVYANVSSYSGYSNYLTLGGTACKPI